MQPPQHAEAAHHSRRNVAFITNCVWAAVYRNVAEDSARNRLHPGIQSDVEGERQQLKPSKKHCTISEDGRFISSKYGVGLRRNDEATCVPKCRQTDRQIAFRLYYQLLVYNQAT